MSIVPNAPVDLDLMFTREVLPVLFLPAVDEPEPTLTLLHTPPGSGAARATAKLASMGDSPAVLSAADLRAFHPGTGSDDGGAEVFASSDVDAAVAEWFRACLVYAREQRRSLLIEGTFLTPTIAAGTAQGFADAGFATRVAVVASSRAEVLLSTVSEHLRSLRARRPVPLPSRAARERDWASIGALVAEAAASPAVGRILVLGRNGEVEAAVARSEATNRSVLAMTTLAAAQERPLTALQAAQWLSELRRVTDFVDSRRDPLIDVREALVELHVLGIRDVVPRLPVPPGSEVVSREEGRLASELVRLRRSMPTPVRTGATGPVVDGPTQGSEGPSR